MLFYCATITLTRNIEPVSGFEPETHGLQAIENVAVRFLLRETLIRCSTWLSYTGIKNGDMGGHREFCYSLAIHLIFIFRILHHTLHFTSVVLVVIVGEEGLEPSRTKAPVPHTTMAFATNRFVVSVRQFVI